MTSDGRKSKEKKDSHWLDHKYVDAEMKESPSKSSSIVPPVAPKLQDFAMKSKVPHRSCNNTQWDRSSETRSGSGRAKNHVRNITNVRVVRLSVTDICGFVTLSNVACCDGRRFDS
ncbi:hypothetical protein NPIL_487731 [Nephila pilipes]|uniref:Uncharacterized protein n=1 Tax=Nephila pilipes TaxID=299642 RepID=A0A8X6U9C2_NEPPI|nr:hypothetical protein NPIL_487731 [Nephila pilipes]